MSPSAGSAKSSVHVWCRRNKAVHLEVEGEPVAVAHPKRQAAGKDSENAKKKGKQSKKKAPPDVPSPITSEADPSSSGMVHVAWLSIVLDLSWSLGSTAHYVKGGFMYPVVKCW
jgi:hypothetical protein